jgi:hypothetical protein
MIPSAYYAQSFFFPPLAISCCWHALRLWDSDMEKFSAADVMCDLWFVVVKFSSVHCPIDQTVGHETAPGGESWGRDCVWDVQSPLFILTARLRRVRRNVEKEKEKRKRPENSIVWQPVVTLGEIGFPFLQSSCPAHGPLPNATTTTNNANQYSPQNFSVNVPSAIRLSGMEAFMIVPSAIKFLISRSIRRVPKKVEWEYPQM